MTREQKEILKQSADLLIQTVSQQVTANPENKEQGREYLKKAIAASELLDKVELEEE
tara:strand:- start:866 stop:1036 length:171 start_codon:yes stop_codon:yes gene_type:complete